MFALSPGDGAGVGKGRQIAALIKELHRSPSGVKRVLWVSTSLDLREDARRDLRDMDALDMLPVYPEGLKPLPKGDLGRHYPKVRCTTSGNRGRPCSPEQCRTPVSDNLKQHNLALCRYLTVDTEV